MVIGATTRRLVGQTFELVELEPQSLKGFSDAVLAWHIIGEHAAEGRFEAAHVGTLTRLIGRWHELGLLHERWKLAKNGEGQVVLLSGEAGIGKSRMMRALDERIADDQPIRLRYQCASHRTNSALFPIIQRLERTVGLSVEDTSESKLDKLEDFLKRTAEDLDKAAPLFAGLLSVPREDRYGPLDLTPQELRNRTNAVLVRQVLAMSRQRPVLLALEDAHWIDPTTETLLGEMMAAISGAAVLMLITHRPGYVPPWTAHAHLTSVTLNRLSREQSAEIVGAVGGDALASAIVNDIIARADGVPLYVEELVKFVVEANTSTAGRATKPQIPETLQASLVARLDRLGAAKEVAQIGSVAGRVFRHELIAAVADRSGDELNGALDRIVESELLFRRGVPPDAVYTFKHALVRDAAYESLLKSKRQQIHARLLAVLVKRPDSAPEILAHHAAEARLVNQSIGYWQQAGEQAIERSANVEAVSNIERGLQALAQLPENSQRDELEVKLQATLGQALVASKGYAEPAVGTAYARARVLCELLGDDERLALVLRGQHVHELAQGRLLQSRDTAEELSRVVEAGSHQELQVGAQHNLSQVHFLLGAPKASLAHGEKGIELYDPIRHSFSGWAGGNPGVQCHVWATAAASVLGDHHRSTEYAKRALELAETDSQPFSRVHCLALLCIPAIVRRDSVTAEALSNRAMEICSEYEIPYWREWARIVVGWSKSKSGESSEGLAELRRGYDRYREHGSKFCAPFFLSLLAELCLDSGDLADGLEAVEQALAMVEESSERWWESETHRIRAKLLAAAGKGGQEEAESSYLRGLDIARAQGAHFLELRTAQSLACLWCDRGKRQKAHDMFAAVYDGFIEGFDTLDLKEAKVFLDELA